MFQTKTILTLFAVVILGIPGYFVYRAMTPGTVRGTLLDTVPVMGRDRSPRLWLLSEINYSYISSSKSPGYTSTTVKCFSCSDQLYLYNPDSGKTEYHLSITTKGPNPNQNLVATQSGKIWLFRRSQYDEPPQIMAIDSTNGTILLDSTGFIQKHEPLKGGLKDILYKKDERILRVSTLDGRDFFFSPDLEQLFEDRRTMNSIFEEKMPAIVAMPSLYLDDQGGSGPRKLLYIIHAPTSSILTDGRNLEEDGDQPEELREMTHSQETNSFLAGNHIYLEGIISGYDDRLALILHLDRVGDFAKRSLTAIDIKTGKELWTRKPEELYPSMEIDTKKNPFSALAFSRNWFKAEPMGNLVFLSSIRDGVMILDGMTGGVKINSKYCILLLQDYEMYCSRKGSQHSKTPGHQQI